MVTIFNRAELTVTFDMSEQARIRSILADMTAQGGRDTEKTIHGHPGGYKTLMSKNALPHGCPVCGSEIRKETYMGGAVYYCENCQPL